MPQEMIGLPQLLVSAQVLLVLEDNLLRGYHSNRKIITLNQHIALSEQDFIQYFPPLLAGFFTVV
jgi:hypothetical protein